MAIESDKTLVEFIKSDAFMYLKKGIGFNGEFTGFYLCVGKFKIGNTIHCCQGHAKTVLGALDEMYAARKLVEENF